MIISRFIRAAIISALFVLPAIAFGFSDGQTDSAYVHDHYSKHEYRIAMRDGVHLYTVVYTPNDSSEQHPIMMMRTPYGVGPYNDPKKANGIVLSKLSRHYLDRNYIFVMQDVRGRYMSEGTFVDVRPYIPNKKTKNDVDESSDAYDTIDWLVKNIVHNNGRVGVKGTSYPGFYTTMACIDAHPALKAASPQAPVSQWMSGDDFYHNGAFLLPHAFDFFSGFGWPRPEPVTEYSRSVNQGTPDEYQFFLRMGALPNANRLYLHDSVQIWNDLLAHGQWDSFWAARSVLPHVKNIKPATMVVGGWYDTENLYGALHLYGQIEKDHVPGAHSIVMGPWAHYWWNKDDVDSLGPIKYGINLSDYFAEQIELPFFEHYLRDKGGDSTPEAHVFLTGANEWKKLDSWPPAGTSTVRQYLSSHGELSPRPVASKAAFDEYVSDPAKPVPYTNEIRKWYNGPFMIEDQRFAARRPDVLVYQTPPLTEDMTVAGPMTVHLTGSTSGTDCDWIVKVIDVFPDSTADPTPNPLNVHFGGYQMMVRGDVLRGKFREGLDRPKAISPNVPTPFTFPLQDIFHQFKKGHRLMVQIQSTWFPMVDRNPGRFENIYQAKDSDFQKTTQRVYHGDGKESYIELPVLPAK